MKRRNWDKHEIKAAIGRRGMTLFRIALDAGLEQSACWVALNRRHYAGEAAIARFLGVPERVLWPDRYPPNASRVASNDASRGSASQNGEAA